MDINYFDNYSMLHASLFCFWYTYLHTHVQRLMNLSILLILISFIWIYYLEYNYHILFNVTMMGILEINFTSRSCLLKCLIPDDQFDLWCVSGTFTQVQIIICKNALSIGTWKQKRSKPNESFWGLEEQSKTWKEQEAVIWLMVSVNYNMKQAHEKLTSVHS